MSAAELPSREITDTERQVFADLLPYAIEIIRTLNGSSIDEEASHEVLSAALGTAARHLAEEAEVQKQQNKGITIAPIDVSSESSERSAEKAVSELNPETETRKRPEVPGYVINPGEQHGFRIAPIEIGKLKDGQRRFMPGIIAIMQPLLDIVPTSLVDPSAPTKPKLGPRIFLSDLNQMRYEEARDLVRDTAVELANRHEVTGDEEPEELQYRIDHYRNELDKKPFKVLVSTYEALDSSEWSTVNSSLLYSDSGDRMDAVYPYLIPNEKGGAEDFELRFSSEGLVETEIGKRIALGIIALKGNIVVTAPYDEGSIAGHRDLPKFLMQSFIPPLDEDLLSDMSDQFDQLWQNSFDPDVNEPAPLIKAAASTSLEEDEPLLASAMGPRSIIPPRPSSPGHKRGGKRRDKGKNEPRIIRIERDRSS